MMLQSRLDNRTRFTFGAGAMPEALKNSSWDMFVLFYFTQVLGLSGTLAGLAIGIALVIDAVIDPSIGSYSDGMRSGRFGRRQTLMAFAVIPFAISFTLLFSPPAGLSESMLFVWLVVLAIVCRSAISLFTIPFFALGIELSRNPLERPILASFKYISSAMARMAMPIVAFTFFFAATPEFPKGQLNAANYPKFGFTIAMVASILMIVCIYGTNRRSKEIERGAASRTQTKALDLVTTFKQIVDVFRYIPNVRSEVGLTIFAFVCLSIVSVYTLHLSTYYWRLSPGDIRNISVAMAPGGMIAAFLARYYVPRFDKRKTMMWAISIFGLVVLVPILGPLTPFFPQSGSPFQVPLLIAFKFSAGLIYGFFVLTSSTVASDIADEVELKIGAPRQALMSSFTFFALGAASGLVNIAAGLFLDVIDFPAGADVDAVSDEMAAKLAIFAGVVIAIAISIVIFFVSRLSISREKQAEINAALEQRYAGKQSESDPATAAAAAPLVPNA
jgi:GPH family glycoside/pentoside/hexuronide:cation symporter